MSNPALSGLLTGVTCAGLLFAANLPAEANRAERQALRAGRDFYPAARSPQMDGEPGDARLPVPDTRRNDVSRPASVYRQGPTGDDATIRELPVDADRLAVRDGARLFMQLIREGRVRLSNAARETMQLDGLSADGLVHWPVPPVRALRVHPGDLNREAADDPVEDLNALRLNAAPGPARGTQFRASSRYGAAGPYEGQSQTPSPRGYYPSAEAPDNGTDPVTAPPAEFFLMLNRLANNSSTRRPLEISSLLRPPYRTAGSAQAGPSNPHSLGLAADIAAFGGHTIRSGAPEECVLAFIALLRALPVGRYRVGVPRAPEALVSPAPMHEAAPDAGPVYPESYDGISGRPAVEISRSVSGRSARHLEFSGAAKPRAYGQYAAARPGSNFYVPQPPDRTASPVPPETDWPFFPPARQVVDAKGGLITKYASERYAPMTDLNDSRIREALELARTRGVNVIAMFPDGTNHIHVDVKQTP